MALDIVIVSQYTGLGTNSRFLELARRLSDGTDEVELVVSSFSHREKAPHPVSENHCEVFQITYIEESGYEKNVSLKRVRSHKQLAKNLSRYLVSRTVPDVVYCAVPSLDVAEVVSNYAKRYGVRLIFDVQDLWPEAFSMVLGNGLISKALFMPARRRANRLYKSAHAVVTVSDTYSSRVKEVRQNGQVETVYLGTDLAKFDSYQFSTPKSEVKPIQIAYIGTLGHSYDLPIVFEAMNEVRGLREDNIKLLVMGGGPLEKKFRKLAQDLAVNVEFTGPLPYEEMVPRLRACDIAVNPIVPGSAGSIINKVADYAAAGLPVINTQESPEYRRLLDDYGAGINCKPGNSDDVANAIMTLLNDPEKRFSMAHGSRTMAENLFDRRRIYGQIISMIKSDS